MYKSNVQKNILILFDGHSIRLYSAQKRRTHKYKVSSNKSALKFIIYFNTVYLKIKQHILNVFHVAYQHKKHSVPIVLFAKIV